MKRLRGICGACLALLVGGPAWADVPTERGIADLTQTTRVQLQVDEDQLTVLQEARFSLDKPGEIHLDRTQLDLGLLVPVVRGAVLDQAAIPAGAQQVEVEGDGSLTAERSAGGVRLRGKLVAGVPALVRTRYSVPFKTSRLDLGYLGRVGSTQVTAYLVAGPPVRVQIAWDHPARPFRFEEGSQRVVAASLAQALRPGEVATLTVLDLPSPPTWPRRVLLGCAGLGALAALSFALALRTRAPSAPAAPGDARA